VSDKSAIEWTDTTWNPVTGCTKVSPGCAHCYIDRTPPFRMTGRKFVKGDIPIILHPERLDAPLKWRKPRRVFVNSLSDLFHEDVPDSYIDRVFTVMALAQRHTFQVLTKRPSRMRSYVERLTWQRLIECSNQTVHGGQHEPGSYNLGSIDGRSMRARFVAGEKDAYRALPKPPLPNVWLGVTAENQRFADERIPILLDTPAAVRFVSLEPLLGPIDLRCESCGHFARLHTQGGMCGDKDECHCSRFPNFGLDWVIVGGESGGPAERRLVSSEGCRPGHWAPKHNRLQWLRSIRDQCVAAGVPFLFKQWGGPRPKSAGRMLDGRTWDEYPESTA